MTRTTKQLTPKQLFAEWKRGQGPRQTSPARRKLFIKLVGLVEFKKARAQRYAAKQKAP